MRALARLLGAIASMALLVIALTAPAQAQAPGGEAPPPAPAPAPAAPPPAPSTSTSPPPGMSPGQATAWDAGRLARQGQLAAAEAKASLAITMPDGKAAGQTQLALIRLRQGRAAEAESAAKLAADAEPTYAPGQLVLVRILALRGKAVQRISALERLTAQNPDKLGLRIALAEAQLSDRRTSDAMATARSVLKKAETSVTSMKILARAYLAAGNDATAESILERAVELRNDAEAYNLLGRISLERKALVKARGRLEKAVQADPNYVEALNNLGVAYCGVRSFAAGLDVLNKALMRAPAFAAAWLNIGIAHRGLGAFDKAEKSWLKAIELDPGLADAQFNLGVLYLENPLPGREREAQLKLSVDAFNAYKKASSAADRDPKVDKFIGEAQLLAAQEKQRKEDELKQPDPEDEEDEFGDDEDEFGDDEDEFGDDEDEFDDEFSD